MSTTNDYHRHNPSLFWPILLIGVGVILLLSNLGYFPADPWPILWQFWPVILIVIGLDIILGRRGVLGSILGAVLGLLLIGGVIAVLLLSPTLARSTPTFFGLPLTLTNAQLKTEHIAVPMGDVNQADVSLSLPAGHGSVHSLGDSGNLIEGDVTHAGILENTATTSGSRMTVRLGSRGVSGFIFGGTREEWNLGLNPGVDMDLGVNIGSGSFDIDLTNLKLKSLNLDHGSGSSSITLPNSGQFQFRLNSGSGSVDVRIPAGMAARLVLTQGSGSMNAPRLTRTDGGRGRNGTWETSGFNQSGAYVIINANVGSGSLNVR